MAQVSLSDFPVAQLNSLLGSVGLVQPFNWNAWKVPVPEIHEIWKLSEDDCVRHVTRFVRADRTNEGVLRGSLRSGVLPALCLVAFAHSGGDRALPLNSSEVV